LVSKRRENNESGKFLFWGMGRLDFKLFLDNPFVIIYKLYKCLKY